MKKQIVISLIALCAIGSFAADSGAMLSVDTRNTSLFLRCEDGTWIVDHYGMKLKSGEDAKKIAWYEGLSPDSLGNRKPAAYSTYGADACGKAKNRSFNKFGGLAVRHSDGVMSTELKSVKSSSFKRDDGRTETVLEMKDESYDFFVTQHFVADGYSDTIETWVDIRNGESSAVNLIRMDSVALDFPHAASKCSVMSLTGQWAAEAQVSEAPVARGQITELISRSGVRTSWGANPALMLTLGEKSTETSGRVIGCVLAWSGATAISVEHDYVDLIELRAGVDTGNGAYLLDSGRTISLPHAVLTFSDSGKGQISRNFHRWARNYRLPHGRTHRDILLNSWEGSGFRFTEDSLVKMMDAVKAMGGELFVLDDGWFGRGKYARDNVHRDRVGLGDWTVNPEKLPHGISFLTEETKKRGLKFGLWFEPEMVCTASWLAEEHPDWLLREPTRGLRTGRGGTQTVLDMSNPAVQDNIFTKLDAILTANPDIAYVKWDANADFYNPGSAYLDKDHQANLWFDYTKGLYGLLDRIRAKHPGLVIQACSSGGGRFDYGFLGYADEAWASDDSDSRERVFIQWGDSQFYPACAIGAHVTDVPNQQTGRVTPLKFRFDVAMTGRFGFELLPERMKPEELEFAKKGVADYKRIRDVVQQGDLYRLVSPYENNRSAIMYVNAEKTHAVLFVLGLTFDKNHNLPLPIRLQGLDPDRSYKILELNRNPKQWHTRLDNAMVRGDALMEMGVNVTHHYDYDSAVIEFTAE